MDFRRKVFESAAPRTTELMRTIEKVLDDPNTDPKLRTDLQSLNDAFQSKMDLKTAYALESAIKSDPAFAKRLHEGILKDPKSIERVLPDAIKNPYGLKATVTAALPAVPDAIAAQQAPAAAPDNPQVAALPAHDPARYPGKGRRDPATVSVPADTGSDPAYDENMLLAEKLDFIVKADGAEKFAQTLKDVSPGSETLILQHASAETSDPEKRRLLIEGLYTRVKDDPQFFNKLDSAVQLHKGAASTAINTLLDNPERGFKELDQKMQLAGFASFFGGLMKPGGGGLNMAGLNGIFDQLLQAFKPIMEAIAGAFNKSSRFALDNPNSKVARAALAATGSTAALEDVRTGEDLPNASRDTERERQAPATAGQVSGPGPDV